MSKRSNHQADIKNPNKGTSGTNRTWDHAQGNRGKQMNPNWTAPKPRDGGGQGAPHSSAPHSSAPHVPHGRQSGGPQGGSPGGKKK